MFVQKLTRVDAFATRQLQLLQRQRAVAAGHHQTLTLSLQHLPGAALTWHDLGSPQLHLMSAELGTATRKRVKGAQPALQRRSRLGPAHDPFGFVDLVCIGHAFQGLRLCFQRSCLGLLHGRLDELATQGCQTVVQQRCGVSFVDGFGLNQQHRPRVQTRIHLHDGDAGAAVTGFDGPVNGRSAAPAWQQRRMDVQAAQARQGQRPGRQDQTIGCHHHQFWRRVLQGRLGLGGILGKLAVQPQAARLGQGQV